MAPSTLRQPQGLGQAGRPSIRDQYEELELSYLERRNQLNDLAARGKIPADLIPHKQRRLQRLRAARETLHRLALAESSGAPLTKPQDMEDAV
jgi:hypothetical protein